VARCLLGLGSNLGNRRELLRNTCKAISKLPDVRLLARSRWHETAPIGGPTGQSPFLNGALLVQTTLQPHALAEKLHELETQLGRSRRVRWSARTVDLDVLLIDAATVVSPDLVVPHPRMSFRRFVLEPAVEIAPWMRHPTSGWTVAQLLRHLNSATRYVAVAAADGRVANWVARQMADTLRFPILEKCTENLAECLLPVICSFWQPTTEKKTIHAMGESSVANNRPALVIAVDPIHSKQLLQAAASAKSNGPANFGSMTETAFRQILDKPGHGPMARITAEDPATILAEAQAAILAVWPETLIAVP